MIVTDITPQKSNNRFNIYVDDQFWFGISADGLVKSQIFQGQQVDLEDLQDIVIEEIENRMLIRATSKLARRLHSEREISQYLTRTLYKKLKDWLDDSFVEITDSQKAALKGRVIQKLIDLDLLSDQKFAEKWVEDRRKYKPRSCYMIHGELMQKGIDKKIIDSLPLGKQQDLEMAEALFQKKFQSKKDAAAIADLTSDEVTTPDQESKSNLKESVIKFLKNKKFTWDVIETILKKHDLK